MYEDEGSNKETHLNGEGELPPFDDAKYRALLEGSDITDEQATEFLRTLDFICRTFVDLGFGVNAVQLAIPELARISAEFESLAEFSGNFPAQERQIEKQSKTFNSASAVKQKDE